MASDGGGPPGMHLVRDTLEALVDPGLATKILFEALDHPDAEVTTDEDGALRFVRGPLAQATVRRAGEQVAAQLIRELERKLGDTTKEEAFPDIEVELETRSVTARGGPVKVLVVTRSTKIVHRLEMALGPQRVAAASAKDARSLNAAAGVLRPEIYIVDGQSGADIPAPELAMALSDDINEPMILIWAADQPWGNAVARTLEEEGVACTEIPRSAGEDPLLDYLRARIAQHGG